MRCKIISVQVLGGIDQVTRGPADASICSGPGDLIFSLADLEILGVPNPFVQLSQIIPVLEKAYGLYLPLTKAKIYLQPDKFPSSHPVNRCLSINDILEIPDLARDAMMNHYKDAIGQDTDQFNSAVFFPIVPYFEGLHAFGKTRRLGVVAYYGANVDFFPEFRKKEIYKRTRFIRNYLRQSDVDRFKSMRHQIKGYLSFLGQYIKNYERQHGTDDHSLNLRKTLDQLLKTIDYFLETKNNGEKEYFSLNELMQDVSRDIFYTGAVADIEIHVPDTIDPKLLLLYEDHQGLKEALKNIIQNALDAVAEKRKQLLPDEFEGRVSITIVSLVLPDGTPGIGITVADNGAGMAREQIDVIMAKEIVTTKEFGEGLGLSQVVIPFLEENKLVFSIDSSKGVGTSFKLLLPVQHKASNSTFTETIKMLTATSDERVKQFFENLFVPKVLVFVDTQQLAHSKYYAEGAAQPKEGNMVEHDPVLLEKVTQVYQQYLDDPDRTGRTVFVQRTPGETYDTAVTYVSPHDAVTLCFGQFREDMSATKENVGYVRSLYMRYTGQLKNYPKAAVHEFWKNLSLFDLHSKYLFNEFSLISDFKAQHVYDISRQGKSVEWETGSCLNSKVPLVIEFSNSWKKPYVRLYGVYSGLPQTIRVPFPNTKKLETYLADKKSGLSYDKERAQLVLKASAHMTVEDKALLHTLARTQENHDAIERMFWQARYRVQDVFNHRMDHTKGNRSFIDISQKVNYRPGERLSFTVYNSQDIMKETMNIMSTDAQVPMRSGRKLDHEQVEFVSLFDRPESPWLVKVKIPFSGNELMVNYSDYTPTVERDGEKKIERLILNNAFQGMLVWEEDEKAYVFFLPGHFNKKGVITIHELNKTNSVGPFYVTFKDLV